MQGLGTLKALAGEGFRNLPLNSYRFESGCNFRSSDIFIVFHGVFILKVGETKISCHQGLVVKDLIIRCLSQSNGCN